MNQIEKLIAELCPEGVEWKALGEVAAYSDTRVDASNLNDYSFVGVDNLLSNKRGKSIAKYLPNTVRLTAYEKGDVLLGNIRPYLKKIWLADDNGGCSGDVLAIRIAKKFTNSISSEYLYYLLSSDSFFAYNVQHSKGAKMPRGSKSAILGYEIPLPSLAIQRKIVDILDKFTSLEAELEGRKKQYEFYREQLLASDGGEVRRVKLGELFELRAGNFISASKIFPEVNDEHAVPCFGGGGLRGYVSTANQRGDRVLIGRQGALCGNIKRINGEFYATEHSIVVAPRDDVDIRWGFHLLTNMDLNQYASKSAQPGLAVGTINQLEIEVPLLEKQQLIGSILDKFDALVNDIAIGLPAEIAARRKQYEYYREKLLTIKRKEV